MDKIGLKFSKALEYELFEPLQYWLDYEVEYDDVLEHIANDEVIELELEEDEDRAEDIEMLHSYLKNFFNEEISYEVFVLNDEWEKTELLNIV